MRLLITTQRHSDAASLIDDVRTVGTKLQAAKPVGGYHHQLQHQWLPGVALVSTACMYMLTVMWIKLQYVVSLSRSLMAICLINTLCSSLKQHIYMLPCVYWLADSVHAGVVQAVMCCYASAVYAPLPCVG